MEQTMDKIMEKINRGREYRDISLANFETKEAGDEMIVSGYATTFNEPYVLYDDGEFRVEEQVDPDAFKECDMSDVIMQYNHEGRVFARISNGTLKVGPDNHGLYQEARLGGTEIGRQLYEEIKGGYTTKMSMGFTVKRDKREEMDDRENNKVTIKRTILSIGKLYDVSAVSIPANNATEISARSYCEGVIAELKEEIEKCEETRKRLKILCEL